MNAHQRISEALERHGRAILSCSGGKDSLAVMHLAHQWSDRITVLFVDMGDAFQHVRPFVEKVCALWGYDLHVVESQPPQGVYPSDLVPTWSTPFGSWFLSENNKARTQIISGLDCCSQTLWTPLEQAIRQREVTLVFRGSKGTDEHVSVTSGTWHDGVEYVNPIEDWEDTQVFWYLREHGVELPEQYHAGVNHSLDCKHCTAWLSTPAEVQRLEYTRRYHPEVFTELQRRMVAILDELDRRSAELVPALEVLFSNQTTDTTCHPRSDTEFVSGLASKS